MKMEEAETVMVGAGGAVSPPTLCAASLAHTHGHGRAPTRLPARPFLAGGVARARRCGQALDTQPGAGGRGGVAYRAAGAKAPGTLEAATPPSRNFLPKAPRCSASVVPSCQRPVPRQCRSRSWSRPRSSRPRSRRRLASAAAAGAAARDQVATSGQSPLRLSTPGQTTFENYMYRIQTIFLRTPGRKKGACVS